MRNIRSGDRVFRLIVGIPLLGLYGALPAPWRYVTLVGLLPLGSAITGSGPIRAWRRGTAPW